MNLARIIILALSLTLAAIPKVLSQSDNPLEIAADLKQQGDYSSAIKQINSSKLQNDQQTIFFLGRLYFLSGQPQQSLEAFARLSRPTWQSLVYQGLAYESLGSLNQAIDSYQLSVKSFPNSLALYRLGKIFYNQDDFILAAKYFKQVIDLDSSIRLAYFYLGDSLSRNKDYSDSYKNLAKANNFYPQNKYIAGQLETVKANLGKSFFGQQKKQIEQTRQEVVLAAYKKNKYSPQIRVGIAKGISTFTFKSGADFTIRQGKKVIIGKANKFYVLERHANQLRLYQKGLPWLLAKFSDSVEITVKDSYPVYILSIIYGNKDFWQKEMDRVFRGDFKVLLTDQGMTLVNILSLEEYLYGVLSAEISAKAPSEALKAQAVAARTIAMRNKIRHNKEGFDFCADVHCQSYQGLSAETLQTIKAVDDTFGEILAFAQKPIEALYHADCGGCLRQDPFGYPVEYLETKFDKIQGFKSLNPWDKETWFLEKPDSFCSNAKANKYRWQRIYDAQDFKLTFGFDIKELVSIKVQEQSDCNHAKTMQVNTVKNSSLITGDLKIRDYLDKLKSSAFLLEIAYQKSNPYLIMVWGAGFGHGAGLCQDGTVNMADQGYTYRQILKHYYPKAQLQNAYATKD